MKNPFIGSQNTLFCSREKNFRLHLLFKLFFLYINYIFSLEKLFLLSLGIYTFSHIYREIHLTSPGFFTSFWVSGNPFDSMEKICDQAYIMLLNLLFSHSYRTLQTLHALKKIFLHGFKDALFTDNSILIDIFLFK